MNGLEFAYYEQPTTLTHLTPISRGPTAGGSVVTVHGVGLAAYHVWGAPPSKGRCRWDGARVTIPTYVSADFVVCPTAAQPFTTATTVSLELALNNVDFIDTATLSYTYYVQPQYARAISPTGGQLRGGTRVMLDGEGFDAYPGVSAEDVRLGWGDFYATNLTTPFSLSPGRLTVASYPSLEPGPRGLSLALNQIDLVPINATFLYYRQPETFDSCLPTGGPTMGGTTVTIVGGPFNLFSDDSQDLLCRFGANYTRALSLLPHEIVCATPPAGAAAVVDVAISLNGAETDFSSIGHAFKYYVQPRVCGAGQDYAGRCLSAYREGAAPSDYVSIAPVGGPDGGATLVTITGEGFMAFANVIEYVRCRWDGGIVDAKKYEQYNAALGAGAPPPETSALEHTATRIVCAAPPARVGTGAWLNVSLSLNAADFADTGLHFTMYATPSYTAITPSGGHREGGTAVTIEGQGFDDLEGGAHVSCQFGHPEDNPAYNPKYTISRPSLVTQTRIVCQSPATKVADTRQLWVALNGYEDLECADPVHCGRNPTATNLNFTYYNPPMVESLMPQAGVFSGDTVVTLLGQGFHGLAGNKAFAKCRFVSSTSQADTAPIELLTDQWTCRSPPQSNIEEGEATRVFVTLNAQQYVDTGYKFSYFGLRIDVISVNGGPPGGITEGGTILTLQGAGFDVGPIRYCRFGESKQQRTTVLSATNDTLLCPTPPFASPVDVHLLLSRDNLVYIDTGLDYTYYVQPSLFTDVQPEGGPKRGGTMTTLTGAGFTRFVSESQPLTDEQRRTAARCLWGGDFSSRLSIAGRLRNAPRTSLLASGELQMTGQAGVSAPIIVRAEFSDPDNRDTSFSNGDTLTIVFDADTNRGGLGVLSEAGDRTLVDTLLRFSHPLGERYNGRWTDASVFQVTLIDVSGNDIPTDLGRGNLEVIGDLKNFNELSRWCKATAKFVGNVGSTAPPQIRLFEAQTWDRDDIGWSRYDTIEIHFDIDTDLGGREGGKEYVDTILSFSDPLGDDYSGQWTDASTLVITAIDVTGAVPPTVNETSGTLITVTGQMRNMPGTSGLVSDSIRLGEGTLGELRAPRLAGFYGRDVDNLNASYDEGDQIVVQFDMAVNKANCSEWAVSVDNYRYCAKRPEGGADFVDSLFQVTASLGANYSGAWEDASTFVITVIEPPPAQVRDVEFTSLAPRPYDTVLAIPPEADLRAMSGTSERLSFGPVSMGVAWRYETFPSAPELLSFTALDPINLDFSTGPGDTLKILFDAPTDRAGRALGGNGRLNQYSEVHELFFFYGRYNQLIQPPLFLEYSSGWVDASTFTVTVINGTEPSLDLLDPNYVPGFTLGVDPLVRVALRPGVEVVLLGCEEQYRALCTVETGWSADLPRLTGDFGRVTAPALVAYTIDDPDNGDAIFGDGDVLTIFFDQKTNRGEVHSDFEQAGVDMWLGQTDLFGIEHPTFISYPFGTAPSTFDHTTAAGRVGYVDSLFEFSQALGDDYSGEWLDDSTFRVLILDGASTELSPSDLAYHRPNPSLSGLGSNVTARASSGITSSNYTSKTCNMTLIDMYGAFRTLLHDPAKINSTTFHCTLHYANSTSPSLTGSLGVPTYPTLISFEVDDVDNGDAEYGVGDVFALQFNMPTNIPSIESMASYAETGVVLTGQLYNGSKALVDALFEFSDPIGEDYSGAWLTPTRFMVTIIDPAGANVVPGRTEVTVISTDVRNAAGDALSANNQTALLFGDFGYLDEPRVARFTVVTPNNASNYTDGDTMVLHMDMATNKGGSHFGDYGDKAYVDALFGFSDVLGTDYSGAWHDGESQLCTDGGAVTLHPCFVIALLDTRTGAAVSGKTIVAPTVHVHSSSGRSQRIFERLSGGFGHRMAPQIAEIVAADADNSAEGVSFGDTLSIRFTVPTDTGVTPPQRWGTGVGTSPTAGGPEYVDSLFRFCVLDCTTGAPAPIGASYNGAWTDESTFVVTVLDPTGSELELGETVVMARHALTTPAGSHRPLRFQGGISKVSNGTSPVLTGDFGRPETPRPVAFHVRDPDNADTQFSAFDEFSLNFTMPTDRAGLQVLSGDKRWVDMYFDFACSLGQDYSGEWQHDSQKISFTVLDPTIGLNPAATSNLADLRITPSLLAHFVNRPQDSGATASGMDAAEPPLRGSRFATGHGLCSGAGSSCGFGELAAPVLVDAYVGDVDYTGSWTSGDYLQFIFDTPTNTPMIDCTPTCWDGISNLFDIRATTRLGDINQAPVWTLGTHVMGNWTDASTFTIITMPGGGELNLTLGHGMPDPSQCGYYDPDEDETVLCADESPQYTADGFSASRNKGFRLRVTVHEAGGIRKASNSPIAAAASGTTDFQLTHCNAGPWVKTATIRDPDNLDTVYGNGDEITVTFTLDTLMPAVTSKWDIDKYLTFCTDCNPGCQREQKAGSKIDHEYNGLGTAYSGYWQDNRTLVITILNSTLPRQQDCESNGNMEWGARNWFVTMSYKAAEAPMIRGCNIFDYEACHHGDPSDPAEDITVDQFGQPQYNYGRMLGPRYPHRWDTGVCEDYESWYDRYLRTGNTERIRIVGNVGPAGTPSISQFVADDPDDLDTVYGAGDTLTVVFDKATDRSNTTTGGVHYGDRLYVDSLFSFNAQLGQDYSGEWLDDSQFTITIVDPSWRQGPDFFADGRVDGHLNCTMNLRPEIGNVHNLAGTSQPFNSSLGPSPELSGDVGLQEAPRLVSVFGADADFGDQTVGAGDTITLTFDIATDRGGAEAGGPFGVGQVVSKAAVDMLFNFSAPLGAQYSGHWKDDSVFVITMSDGDGSGLNSALGALELGQGQGIVVNPIGTIHQQGCRPGVTDRAGSEGMCTAAEGFVGPMRAVDGPMPEDQSPYFLAQFGVRPRIVRTEVDDPDNGDSVVGPGDKLRVFFDQATDRGGGETAGNREYVDGLFGFSFPLGLDYMGEWEDDSIFVVTVINTISAPMAYEGFTQLQPHMPVETASKLATLLQGDGVITVAEYQAAFPTITVEMRRQVRDKTGQSLPSLGMARMTEDEARVHTHFPVYGTTTPQLVRASVEDTDNKDDTWSPGDFITLTFDMPTNRAAEAGDKAFVDRLFRIEPSIGTDYSGEWVTERLFRIQALDTVGGELLLCNHDGCTAQQQSNATLVGILRNRGSTSQPTSTRAKLSGVSDEGPPLLEKFEVRAARARPPHRECRRAHGPMAPARPPQVSDPDNLDYFFTDDDIVTAVFDRATDLGANEGPRTRVDALLSFNIPPGADYSGAWQDDSTFIVTVTDTLYRVPLINHTKLSLRADVRAASGKSAPIPPTEMKLLGNFGSADRPRLVGFGVQRMPKEVGLVAGPMLYTLTFDKRTDMRCSFCRYRQDLAYPNGTIYQYDTEWTFEKVRASVDELFVFSEPLGSQYSGEWRDPSTFEVTVITPLINSTQHQIGISNASVRCCARVHSVSGKVNASLTEQVHLHGEEGLLIPPGYYKDPPTVLPAVSAFVLYDVASAQFGPDVVGENASVLLRFDRIAHFPGDRWYHCEVDTDCCCDTQCPEGARPPPWGCSTVGNGTFPTFSFPRVLNFSQPLGRILTGHWLSRDTLVITVHRIADQAVADATGGRPRIGVTYVNTVVPGLGVTPFATLSAGLRDVTTTPTLLSVEVVDPDDLDFVYSAGDTVTLKFDAPTDRGGALATKGNRQYVDSLVAFSDVLAYDYSGSWNEDELYPDQVFTITIVQATCPGCTPFPGLASVKPTDVTEIKTRASSSSESRGISPILEGDFGKTRGPAIVSFVADDFDNGDAVYGAGDTLTVVFDLATDRGGLGLFYSGEVPVEDMLTFSHSLGAEAQASWTDDSTLVVTVIDPTGAEFVFPGKTTVRPKQAVRNRGCCPSYTVEGCAMEYTCCCWNATDIAPVVLEGDFGNALAPGITSFVGYDPDDGDDVYGASDVVVVSFDMATDQARGDPFGQKAFVDDLLYFSQPIGDDYSAEWIDDASKLRISILAAPTTASVLPVLSLACEDHPGPGCIQGVPPAAPLNMSKEYWSRTLVLARGGDGVDNDEDGSTGDLRSRAGVSPIADIAPIIDGTLGSLAPPRVVSFGVDDPDNDDPAYSDGDVFVIGLDHGVNVSAGFSSSGLGRDEVDRLFSFSTVLGRDYYGAWRDASTFRLVVTDVLGAGGVAQGVTRVFPSVRPDAVMLRNSAGCKDAQEHFCQVPFIAPPVELTGGFGELLEAPYLAGFEAGDYDNADDAYSQNDTLTISFSGPTNKGSVMGADGSPMTSGGEAYIASLFNFSHVIGKWYYGEWVEDGSAFVITVKDTNFSTLRLEDRYEILNETEGTPILMDSVTVMRVLGEIRQPKGNSPPITTNMTAKMTGSFGDNATFPTVVSVVGRETVRQTEWEIVVQLDRATDRGRINLPQPSAAEIYAAEEREEDPPLSCDPDGVLSFPCLSRLFRFLPTDAFAFGEWSVEDQTSGMWRDDSTFVLTTGLDVTGSTLVLLDGDFLSYGLTQEPNFQIGSTGGLMTSGLTANGTQNCQLYGLEILSECPDIVTLPSPEPPVLIGFEVDDPDNGDASLSVGDVFRLTFDREVDRAECEPSCSGDRYFVHRFFSFSTALATDYSGAWHDDNKTFVITVTEVDPDFVAPRVNEVYVALRPPNSELDKYVDPTSPTESTKTISEAAFTPWLALVGYTYDQWSSNQGIPDRIAVRTHDGLSTFATPVCSTLIFMINKGEVRGRHTIPSGPSCVPALPPRRRPRLHLPRLTSTSSPRRTARAPLAPISCGLELAPIPPRPWPCPSGDRGAGEHLPRQGRARAPGRLWHVCAAAHHLVRRRRPRRPRRGLQRGRHAHALARHGDRRAERTRALGRPILRRQHLHLLAFCRCRLLRQLAGLLDVRRDGHRRHRRGPAGALRSMRGLLRPHNERLLPQHLEARRRAVRLLHAHQHHAPRAGVAEARPRLL